MKIDPSKLKSTSSARKHYIALGLFPLPIRAVGERYNKGGTMVDASGKEVSLIGWTTAQEDAPAKSFRKNGNIGLRLGKLKDSTDDIVAIDLDGLDDVKEPHKHILEWMRKQGNLSEVPRIKSGRGYKIPIIITGGVPEGEREKRPGKQNSASNDKFNVEAYIGEGCQIVIPPSKHHSGTHNKWENTDNSILEMSFGDFRRLVGLGRAKKGGKKDPLNRVHVTADDIAAGHYRMEQILEKHGLKIIGKQNNDWINAECPLHHEHHDGEGKDGFHYKVLGEYKVKMKCHHSGDVGHSEKKTHEWEKILGISSNDEYGDEPTREWVERELVAGRFVYSHGKSETGTIYFTEQRWRYEMLRALPRSKDNNLAAIAVARTIGDRWCDFKTIKEIGKRCDELSPIVKKQREDGLINTKEKKSTSENDELKELMSELNEWERKVQRWFWDALNWKFWVHGIESGICGYEAGIRVLTNRAQHRRVLIQKGADYPTPKIGATARDCPWIIEFLKTRLWMHEEQGAEQSIQYYTLLHHIRNQYRRFTTKRFHRRTQGAFVIGLPTRGKTLLGQHLLRWIYGGRVVECWNALTDANNSFNAQLDQAELLICDDSIKKIPLRLRSKFESILKQLVGAGSITLERKGSDAITIENHPAVFWGFVNPDATQGLPTMGEGAYNKWHIFQFNDIDVPEPDRAPTDGKSEHEVRIHEERAAFLGWLLRDDDQGMSAEAMRVLGKDRYAELFRVEGMKGQHRDIQRFEMREFHHGIGEKAFDKGDHAHQLRELMQVIFKEPFEGTSSEFVDKIGALIDAAPRVRQNEWKIIAGSNPNRVVGKLFARISGFHGSELVNKGKKWNGTVWLFTPPTDSDNPNEPPADPSQNGAPKPPTTPPKPEPETAFPPAATRATNENFEELKAEVGEANEVALDIETYGSPKENALCPRKGNIRIIGLACDGGNAWYVDLHKFEDERIRELIEILKHPRLLIHNAKFDLQFLRQKYGFIPEGEVNDTMLMAGILNNGLRKGQCAMGSSEQFGGNSLGVLIEKELGIKLDKSMGAEEDWGNETMFEDARVLYVANDVIHLPALRDALMAKLQKHTLLQTYHLERDLLPVIVDVEARGFPIDTDMAHTISQDTEAELGEVEYEIEKRFGEMNPTSSKQVIDALKKRGIDIKSTSASVLKNIAEKCPDVNFILKHRELNKRLTGALRPLCEREEGGRIYGKFNSLGAATGRFSASAPNLQTIPRGRVRDIVRAPKGRVLLAADYSAIELRAAAAITGEQSMIDAFNDGADLHKLTASKILGKPIDEITKEDRQIAKGANFGLLYGSSAKGLKGYCKSTFDVEISDDEAVKHREAFFRAYPSLKKWHQETKNSPNTDARTRIERRRLYDDGASDWARYSGTLSTNVSGTCADGLKRAMIAVAKALPETAFIVATIHDEILIEADETDRDKVAAIMIEQMVTAMSEMLPGVKIECEVK